MVSNCFFEIDFTCFVPLVGRIGRGRGECSRYHFFEIFDGGVSCNGRAIGFFRRDAIAASGVMAVVWCPVSSPLAFTMTGIVDWAVACAVRPEGVNFNCVRDFAGFCFCV